MPSIVVVERLLQPFIRGAHGSTTGSSRRVICSTSPASRSSRSEIDAAPASACRYADARSWYPRGPRRAGADFPKPLTYQVVVQVAHVRPVPSDDVGQVVQLVSFCSAIPRCPYILISFRMPEGSRQSVAAEARGKDDRARKHRGSNSQPRSSSLSSVDFGQDLRQHRRLSVRRIVHVQRHAFAAVLAQVVGDLRILPRPVALQIRHMALGKRATHRVACRSPRARSPGRSRTTRRSC